MWWTLLAEIEQYHFPVGGGRGRVGRGEVGEGGGFALKQMVSRGLKGAGRALHRLLLGTAFAPESRSVGA